MNEQKIKELLEKLAEFQAQRDAETLQKNSEKQALIDAVLTPEIKQKLSDIEAEFAGRGDAVASNIAELEAQIRTAVIESGTSVKGSILHAVYAKGRVSWDTKALDGYVKAHPELAEFRKEGEPSVSIRASK